jgi:hypothetical protein
MASFEAAFSSERIIWELCKARVRLAEQRHEVLFYHNIDRRSRVRRRLAILDIPVRPKAEEDPNILEYYARGAVQSNDLSQTWRLVAFKAGIVAFEELAFEPVRFEQDIAGNGLPLSLQELSEAVDRLSDTFVNHSVALGHCDVAPGGAEKSGESGTR